MPDIGPEFLIPHEENLYTFATRFSHMHIKLWFDFSNKNNTISNN